MAPGRQASIAVIGLLVACPGGAVAGVLRPMAGSDAMSPHVWGIVEAIDGDASRPTLRDPIHVAPSRTDRDLECGPIEGLQKLSVEPLLLFGEVHGTDGSPAVFGDIVCHLANAHGEVVIGLEIAHDEQDRIDAFLASEGNERDRRRLLAGAFWTDPYQDGRRSQAMAELLEELRDLRATGVDVRVIAFDPLPDVAFRDREEGLARNLVDARRRHPDRPFAVLTGNIHARTTRGTPWDPEFVPMGGRIEAAGIDVLSLDIRHAGGSAWTCTGASADDCGPHSIGGAGGPREAASLELFAQPDADTGYAGAVWVGEVEASPPAVEGSRPREPSAR